MEAKDDRCLEDELELQKLVVLARAGNKSSMLELLQLFQQDIDRLARYLRMPADEAQHILQTHLLTFILEEES